ncbi:MAG: hypothetical protein M3N91_01100 [Pseudomonadota bacterium]|nr:hypothetical protein [Pseudomonadota bacterium]
MDRNLPAKTTTMIKSNITAPAQNMMRPLISEFDLCQNPRPPIDIPPEKGLGPGPKATQLTITPSEANTTIAAA